MEIRYSYSPSFENGWAVGISLDDAVIPATPTIEIRGGRIVVQRLAVDAHIGLKALPEVVDISENDPELDPIDIEKIRAAMSSVSFQPAPFPWAVLDGSRKALLVDTFGTLLCAEWNGHPDEWKGLEEFHETMSSLRDQYGSTNNGEQGGGPDA